MASTSKQVVDFVRCFCGCTELSLEEVKRIAYLNTKTTLNDEAAVKIFRSYLQLKRAGKNLLMAEIYLNVYKELQEATLDTAEMIEDLAENVEMPREMEKQLTKALENGDIADVKEKVLMECCNSIEASEHYAGYKKELRKKLHRAKKSFKCT